MVTSTTIYYSWHVIAVVMCWNSTTRKKKTLVAYLTTWSSSAPQAEHRVDSSRTVTLQITFEETSSFNGSAAQTGEWIENFLPYFTALVWPLWCPRPVTQAAAQRWIKQTHTHTHVRTWIYNDTHLAQHGGWQCTSDCGCPHQNAGWRFDIPGGCVRLAS